MKLHLLAILCLSSICWILPCKTNADQLRVVYGKIVSSDRYGSAETKLIVEDKHGLPDSPGEFVTTRVSVHFPGVYKSIDKQDHMVLSNAKHNVLAVALELTDDRSQVYLIMGGPYGRIAVVPDLNAIVDHLCFAKHKKFDSLYMMPVEIFDRSIKLRAGPHGDDCFEITLSFNDSGAFTLQSYKQLAADPYV